MINKQNLWFITLFSLIMVLSIYYLTTSNDTLSNINVAASKEEEKNEAVVKEEDSLVSLKVASEEELVSKITELENILSDATSSLEEKNAAYESLQTINKNESTKDTIEKLIKEKFDLDSHVKIDGDNINIITTKKEHDPTLANNIIRSVQELYDKNMYITVKFDN